MSIVKITPKDIVGKYGGRIVHNGSKKKEEYPFKMEIFKYNPKNKLFLAECNDEFGDSSIIGAICLDSRMIKFDKYYLREDGPSLFNDWDDSRSSLFHEPMFRKLSFRGIFGGEPLDFGGTYFYSGIKEPGGSWEMVK